MQVSYDMMRAIDLKLIKVAAQTDGFDEDFSPEVRPADPRFGDYQANGVLPFSKRKGLNPREMAERLVKAWGDDDSLKIGVAGPGFLNFTLDPHFRLEWLSHFSTSEILREGAIDDTSGNVVVDFSSPNTAKQMHVGHIRSTIIGDVLARILNYCGAQVIRDNHVGDWGTQFGILILAIKRTNTNLRELGKDALARLEDLYREGTELVNADESLRSEARAELVKLQQGDEENLEIWEKVNQVSLNSFQEVYDLLDVRFDETMGESYFRDKVDSVYEEMIEHKICEESDGALVVFHPEHKRFSKQPFIIRKSDGASNYATTDLATLRHRSEEMGANKIVYVTDGRQQDHFEQLFLTAGKWYASEKKVLPDLEHVWFGTILGEDNKAIKTREGQPIKLLDLLGESVSRARAIVESKNPDLEEEEKTKLAEAIGIGAVRYADLSQDRTLDYVFSWEKLLALQGNTAPYLQYAVTRIRSIFRKLDLSLGEGEDGASPPETQSENLLARRLLFFPSVLEQTVRELKPHHLCGYLYELATEFSSFYNSDKVMTEEGSTKARRLLLCSRTALVLETGLKLLGIEVLDRM